MLKTLLPLSLAGALIVSGFVTSEAPNSQAEVVAAADSVQPESFDFSDAGALGLISPVASVGNLLSAYTLPTAATKTTVGTTYSDFTGVKAVRGYNSLTLKATFNATSVKTPLKVTVQYRPVGTTAWSVAQTTTLSSSAPTLVTGVHWNIPSAREYRIVTAADATRNAYTSGIVRVNKEPGSQNLQVYGTSYLPRVVPWLQQSVTTFNTYKATKILQEKRGTTWVNLVTLKDVNGTHQMKLPVGTRTSTKTVKTYRVVVLKADVIGEQISAPFTVSWENPNHYVDSKKKIYDFYKAHCPNVILDIKDIPGPNIGLAYFGKNLIQIEPSAPYKHWQTLALHECAHHRQYDLQRADWAGFKQGMNRIHGTSGDLGMERNAHCIAHRWKAATFWTYGTNAQMCTTGSTGAAALRLAQGYKW